MKIKYSLLISILLWFGCENEEPEIVEPDSKETLEFVTNLPTSIDHNKLFSYSFEAVSSISNEVSYATTNLPDWISYDTAGKRVYGTPGWSNRGQNFIISITASDSINSTRQTANISVTFANIICDQNFGDPSASDYILPFKPNVSSEIMQSYCNPSNSHNNTFAYDFLLELGEDIIASRSGIAVEIQAGFPDGNGVSGEENFVYVQHEDGSVLRYVHLMQNSVPFAEGAVINQGQVIGKNGLSGGTPRPHLHFELFREFTWSDKRYALPVNFNNVEGRLDNNNGLIVGNIYTAK